MGKIIDVIKQFNEVVELRKENEVLYDEKQYLEVELEEKKRECEFAQRAFKDDRMLLKTIKEIVNSNQNGSVINLQNTIRSLLEDERI